MKNFNNIYKIATSIILSFILIIAFLYNLTNSILDSFEKTTVSNMENMLEQQKLSLIRELEKNNAEVEDLANTISIFGYDDVLTIEYLKTVQSDLSFENAMLVDTNGFGILQSGEIIDIGDQEYFRIAKNGTVSTSEPHISEVSNKTVITVAAPIYYQDEVGGVIAAEYSIDYFTEIINDPYGENSFTVILNNNRDIILSSGNLVDFSFTLDQNAIEDDILATDIYKDIVSLKAGNFVYNLFNQRYFIAYSNLGFRYWSIVIIVPESIIATEAENISNTIINMLIFIIIISGLVISSYMYYRYKNIKKLEQIAYYDQLTGLRNIEKFKIDATDFIESNPNMQFTSLIVDIVNFKTINELFSYEVGDEVIKTLASLDDIEKNLEFVTARYDTDALIVIANSKLFEDVDMLMNKYEKIFEARMSTKVNYHIDFRIGRYVIEANETNINDIISKTSIAHNLARETNSRSFDYDEKIKNKLRKEIELNNIKEDAMKNNEFKAFLQPKYDITNSTIIGAEALVRWIRSDNSMIYPNDFIPLFEQNGYIIDLDFHIFETVCKTLHKWMANDEKCVTVSCNFSRHHLSNPFFVNQLIAISDKYQIPRKYLEVEITETTIMQNEVESLKTLAQIHKEGYGISIDDFGSGYSSLGLLRTIKADVIKLDRSFFQYDDDRGEKIIEGIIKLAQSLNMYTVAEGVEELRQVDFLNKIECNAAQGYYYAKPMPIEDFEKLLHNKNDK